MGKPQWRWKYPSSLPTVLKKIEFLYKSWSCFDRSSNISNISQECAETKRKYTFGQLRDKSSSFSKSLRKHLKLKDGDVIAVVLRNVPEYPIVNLGIMKANLIVTPVSPAFTAGKMKSLLTPWNHSTLSFASEHFWKAMFSAY